MLERIAESFFSKVGEKLVDYAEDTVRGIKDYNFTLETLERNLKSLSAKASDVEEEIKNAERSGTKKRKREVEDWLKHVQTIESEFRTLESELQAEGFIRRFLGGDRANKLNEQLCELVEQSRHFGELVLDVYECSRGEALLTRRLVGEAFEENLERIWRMLVTDNVCSSIGIYGMGGVGKTTLAKHIHNRFLEKTRDLVIWVTVSQEFSIMKLQDEIAQDVHVDLSDEHNGDRRAARLNRALSSLRNNFVLILDDIWKNISLEKLGDPLSVEGCKLILTTRSLEVCRQIGCQEIVEVETLGMNEAWKLFSETLGSKTILYPQVKEIAMSMAKVCDGLPLGIITIAASMRCVYSVRVWRNALAELKEYSAMGQDDDDDDDGVFKVLKYSFDRLDSKHQQCFLYCSLYPEDHDISRGELVSKFISDELLDKRKSWRAQLDQGHAILDKLVNVCLLERLQYGDCVKMHDLVRAMALKITQGRNMVVAGCLVDEIPNEEEWTEDLEKMSLMNNSIEEIPDGMSPNCPKLSTLLLQRNPLESIANSFFSRMQGLCTLDLSQTHIKELPNSLCDLESLKALLLGQCTALVCVPCLGKLKALRELDLTQTSIKEVPQGMDNLVNLKRLSMNRVNCLLPRGLLLHFSQLQYLHLPYHIEAPVDEIERSLKQLEEFRGRVKDVNDFNRFTRYQQSKGSNTCYLIQVGDDYLTQDDTPLADYKKLIVNKCNLDKDTVNILLAQDVQQLHFNKCGGLSDCLVDDIPRLNNPKDLKTLKISKCGGIQCILTHEQFLMAKQELECSRSNPVHLLQSLERIVLSGLWDFTGVIQYKQETARAFAAPTGSPPPAQEAAVFSSLRFLVITNCNKMTKLGLPVPEFQNLEYVWVSNCGQIEELIQDDSGTKERPEGRTICLNKLKELNLSDLPRLKTICNATMDCGSIRRIELTGCPALTKLPLFFPQCSSGTDTLIEGHEQSHCYSAPPALGQIWIGKNEKEWWESLEWEHHTHKNLLQPFLRFE